MTSGFVLECGVTGLMLSDATPQFEVISITNDRARALPFPDVDAARGAEKILRAVYPTFAWRASLA